MKEEKRQAIWCLIILMLIKVIGDVLEEKIFWK
jgi:hypothetical protein